jgi:hypothetical protein
MKDRIEELLFRVYKKGEENGRELNPYVPLDEEGALKDFLRLCQNKTRTLEAKILQWHNQTKDDSFADFMGITKSRYDKLR